MCHSSFRKPLSMQRIKTRPQMPVLPMATMVDAQEETKATTETELGDLQEKMNNYEKFKKEKSDDKDAELDTAKAVGTDCAWVKSHFDKRRQKRKTEIDGLVDAKAFLAGVAAGNDPLPLARF